jgi:hypothetical protein
MVPRLFLGLSLPAGIRVTSGRASRGISTSALFSIAAVLKVTLAWYYDTKILRIREVSGTNARGVPPEIAAILSKPHISLVHYAVTLSWFVVSTVFITCCLQLAFLLARRDVAFRLLFRAVVVAAFATLLASAIGAAEMMAHGGGVASLQYVHSFSLAEIFLPVSSSGTASYLILSAFTFFEMLWVLLLVTQTSCVADWKLDIAVVVAVWTLLTLFKWTALTLLPRVLT